MGSVEEKLGMTQEEASRFLLITLYRLNLADYVPRW